MFIKLLPFTQVIKLFLDIPWTSSLAVQVKLYITKVNATVFELCLNVTIVIFQT